ncbi:MAG: hypothetical protein MJE68_19045, partial [Proteobacteria bacterium]|nr:hypothetical protein [Pseudomonadota bacterium]
MKNEECDEDGNKENESSHKKGKKRKVSEMDMNEIESTNKRQHHGKVTLTEDGQKGKADGSRAEGDEKDGKKEVKVDEKGLKIAKHKKKEKNGKGKGERKEKNGKGKGKSDVEDGINKTPIDKEKKV